MDVMYACFQTSGICPFSWDSLNFLHKGRENAEAHSFKTAEWILSGRGAAVAFSLSIISLVYSWEKLQFCKGSLAQDSNTQHWISIFVNKYLVMLTI